MRVNRDILRSSTRWLKNPHRSHLRPHKRLRANLGKVSSRVRLCYLLMVGFVYLQMGVVLVVIDSENEQQVVQQCYTKFQEYYSEKDTWKIILEHSEELEAYECEPGTIADRTRLFRKTMSSVEKLVRRPLCF